ncbi:MEDS domain-containing protein [Umezawaea tangerina]|uniref:DcmR-like sensory protein n=1 Tax=Umezawaea tangerina TaxID=84725 RepID=A0A2T0T3M7_9PSEU|nr:MEDS domain-containing protein [Umezawaea tangerina]PRY40285.1 DcmR-like sensory protein [Umezawaea tangerina]
MTNANFRHDAAVYGSDEEFLAMAVPFVVGGLDLGEPVLVTTTPANIDLLRRALGGRADDFDHAETAYFGRRPPERATEFFRYWQRRSPGSGRNVRVLAEPLWAGRTERDVRAWRRMESGLNVVLADTNVWMICPYDTRVVSEEGVSHALRTHPADVRGTEYVPSAEYVDPVEYAHACDAVPLPERPADAAVQPLRGDPNALRRFIVGTAVDLGLSEDSAAMLTVAVGEALAFLRDDGHVAMWVDGGAVVCELSGAASGDLGPFAGFRPPEMHASGETGDGLWITRQICEVVDIRTSHGVAVFRLHMSGPRTAELGKW